MGTGAPSCARITHTTVLDPGAPGLPQLSSPRRHGAAWSVQGTFQPWGQDPCPGSLGGEPAPYLSQWCGRSPALAPCRGPI